MEKVDIRPIKLFVAQLPHDCTLRTVILLNEDMMEVSHFLAQLPLWLKLARLIR
jgi:hypothetical protein